MADTSRYSYDEIPYLGNPHAATHPDQLATLAVLMGMQPADPEHCRVLELGSGMGNNLIPMAESLPESRFVGIDLSERQVAAARDMANALALSNIDFQARSILDVGDELGQFDYVICHGVFSWVPAAVQDKILALCRRNLSGQGVAYVSYNTFPGWHQRGMVREMIDFHVQQFPDSATRVKQARALVGFLASAAAQPESSYAQGLREEAELLAERPDYYLFHEHLEEANQPLYFHEFAARAAAVGLQYLGEAWQHSTLLRYPTEVQETLRGMSSDLIMLEQYADFLSNRTFRRTLLCHAKVKLNRAPSTDIAARFHMEALARPTSERVVATSTDTVEFRTDDGMTVSTNAPLVKTALMVLFEAWPELLPFEDLCHRVESRLVAAHVQMAAKWRHGLAGTLLQFYLSNLVRMHVHVPRFVLTLGTRPVARPLARYQAEQGQPITSLLHRGALLNELDRALLPLLDGSRNRSALVDGLVHHALAGKLTIRNRDQPITDSTAIRAALEASLEPSLVRLARSALLIG
jgi:methyltransferase-like protein/cyclopropane fatty-acyl-phospholipid synthase-like methyltransferase